MFRFGAGMGDGLAHVKDFSIFRNGGLMMYVNATFKGRSAGLSLVKPIVAKIVVMFLLSSLSAAATAQSNYLVQPGDVLAVSVWNEEELTGNLTVHPDGTFSVPLIGTIRASGRPINEIEKDVTKGLSKYIPEAIVTIGLHETVGTSISVIGQVNTPGVFRVDKATDVMQALSLAGGMTAFASQNKIKILRRRGDSQEAIPFRYGSVSKGEDLQQNIILMDGDVVVVP